MIGEWVVAMGNPYAYLLGNAEPTVTVGVVSATVAQHPADRRPDRALPRHDPDRRRHQPGQLGRPAHQRAGRGRRASTRRSSATAAAPSGSGSPSRSSARSAWPTRSSGTARCAGRGSGSTSRAPPRCATGRARAAWSVAAVTPEGPAARAGLKAGDVLVEANGRRLRNYLDWEAVKLDLHVGDDVDLSVRSGGGTVRRRIVTGDLPTVTAEKVTVLQDLQLINVTPQIQAERGIRSEHGALIFRISPQVSRATGLQEGDVIVGINRSAVRTRRAGRKTCSTCAPGEVIRVYLERDGQITFTDLVVPMTDDRWRSPLGTRYASPAMQIAVGRAAPDRPLAPALAGAGRGRARARARHPGGRAGPDARPPRRRGPGRRRPLRAALPARRHGAHPRLRRPGARRAAVSSTSAPPARSSPTTPT